MGPRDDSFSPRASRPPEIPNTRRRNGKDPCLLDVDCVAGVKKSKRGRLEYGP